MPTKYRPLLRKIALLFTLSITAVTLSSTQYSCHTFNFTLFSTAITLSTSQASCHTLNFTLSSTAVTLPTSQPSHSAEMANQAHTTDTPTPTSFVLVPATPSTVLGLVAAPVKTETDFKNALGLAECATDEMIKHHDQCPGCLVKYGCLSPLNDDIIDEDISEYLVTTPCCRRPYGQFCLWSRAQHKITKCPECQATMFTLDPPQLTAAELDTRFALNEKKRKRALTDA